MAAVEVSGQDGKEEGGSEAEVEELTELGVQELVMAEAQLMMDDEIMARKLASNMGIGFAQLDDEIPVIPPEVLAETGLFTHEEVADVRTQDIGATLKRVFKHSKLYAGYKKRHFSSRLDFYRSGSYGHGWDCGKAFWLLLCIAENTSQIEIPPCYFALHWVGYKNLQMMFSSLLANPQMAKHLKQFGIHEVPTIPELQGRIETAWKEGFDEEGQEELQHLLDETKWIGPMEVCALLRSLHIRSNIRDFSNTVENRRLGIDKLMSWVTEYYGMRCAQGKIAGLIKGPGMCPNCSGVRKSKSFIPPIFMQHPGHSRTIVGVDVFSNALNTRVFVLDPSLRFGKRLHQVNLEEVLLGRGSPNLGHLSYQIVYIEANPFFRDAQHWEQSKSVVKDC